MAGIGEAASIAGLITLAGQCIDQVSKLYYFGKGYRRASPQAQAVVDELGLLAQYLNQVRNLAVRAKDLVPYTSEAVAAINASLLGCRDTITDIERGLLTVHPDAKHHVWNKIKVAARTEYFPQIQTRIASVKQDLILKLDALSLELDLHTTSNIERLITSTSSIACSMTEMQRSFNDCEGATERHLESLDARLQAMLKIVERSTSSQQMPRLKSRSTPTQRRCPRKVLRKARSLELVGSQAITKSILPSEYEFFRLVYPALLQYERGSTTYKKLVFMELEGLEKLDEPDKRNMIVYLQSLRMLLWLFRQENYVCLNSFKQLSTRRSSLTRQAGITSFWEFSNAFTELKKLRQKDFVGRLSWSKVWLEYLFDGIQSQLEGSEQSMSAVLEPISESAKPLTYPISPALRYISWNLLIMDALEQYNSVYPHV